MSDITMIKNAGALQAARPVLFCPRDGIDHAILGIIESI